MFIKYFKNREAMTQNERISVDTFRELQEVIELAKAQIETMSHSANSVLFGAWNLAEEQREAMSQTMSAANELQKRVNAIKSKLERITDWSE
jgi:methyl-accepting chemotaxis protein